MTEHIGVLGAGSWGTTFAKVLADAGQRVCLWARNPDTATEITTEHTNKRYLKDVTLPETVYSSADIAEVVHRAGIIVLALPAQSLRDNLSTWWDEGIFDNRSSTPVVVSLMKGIEAGTGLRMSQVIAETLRVPKANIAVVSGPNLAKEIAAGEPTATVIASESGDTAERVAAVSANTYFRPYTNPDVVGVELGGAVKNVIALAVGMADGQGLGDNSKASIITRGLAETTRLAVALGGSAHTLSGLAGLGDLVATCASPLSRNRSFGRLLGSGISFAEATQQTWQTAEGVKSAAAVTGLGRAVGVELPIAQAVVAVLDGDIQVDDLAGLLLSRKRKTELSHLPSGTVHT